MVLERHAAKVLQTKRRRCS